MEKGVGRRKALELYRLLVERTKKKGSASEYMKGDERRDFWRWQREL